MRSSGNSEAVAKYKIGAAVTLHPVASAMFVQPRVPIFFGTGTADIVVPPLGVIGMYEKTSIRGKVVAEITGATHFEPNTIGPNRWTVYAAASFGCHLYGIEDGCETVYGADSSKCDLCACAKVPMSLCKHTAPAVNNSSQQQAARKTNQAHPFSPMPHLRPAQQLASKEDVWIDQLEADTGCDDSPPDYQGQL